MTIILTDENFEREIQSADKPVLVDFFATWCDPCSILAPILEKVAGDLKEKIILLKANIDEIPQTAQKFQIDRIPTVILFEKGKPVGNFIGLRTEEDIKEWLKEILKDDQSKDDQLKDDQSGIIEELMEKYSKYAEENGFKLNPDKQTTERVIKGLLENEKKHGQKYCPCRRVTGDKEEDSKKICPCIWHKDEINKDGHCLCRLYVR